MIHFLTKSHSSIRHRYSIWHIMWWLTVFYTCYIFPISVTSLSSCRLLRLVTLSYMRIPPVLNLSNVKRYYTLLQATNQHARGFSYFFNSIHKCNTQTERVSRLLSSSVWHAKVSPPSLNDEAVQEQTWTWVGKNSLCTATVKRWHWLTGYTLYAVDSNAMTHSM